MKIWLLTSEMPGPGAGGIARYVHRMAALWASRSDYEVTVIHACKANAVDSQYGYRRYAFASRNYMLADIAESSVKSPAAFPYNFLPVPMGLAWEIAEVAEALAEEEGLPDIIEVQEYQALGYFLQHRKALGMGALQQVPVVVHLHTPHAVIQELNHEPRYKHPNYWLGRLELASIGLADSVISPSHFLLNDLQTRYAPEFDLQADVIPHAVGAYAEKAASRASGAAHGSRRFRLVYVGRLEPRKGVFELLSACETLWREGIAFDLELYGWGVVFAPRGLCVSEMLRKRYQHRIDQGCLKLSGESTHEDCLMAMRRADAVTVPSLYENFPNTALEALGQGKLLIASRQGGQAEMAGLDGQASLLFDHAVPGDLERVLRFAVEMSPAEREHRGKLGQQRLLERSDPDRVLAAREAHFKRVLAAFPTQHRSSYPYFSRRLRKLEASVSQVASASELTPCKPGKVSIVIPFYNLAATLPETLESALATRYPDYEVLIVNDGSSDPAARELLQTIRQTADAKVRIIDQPNAGLAETRNRGAALAEGEFVTFLDADDCLLPDFVSKTVAVLQRFDNVALAYSLVEFFEAQQATYFTWSFDIPYLLAHNLLIPICTVRRDVFLQCAQNRKEMYYGLEDYDAWIALAEAGWGGVAIPEVLCRYRVREQSMFRSITPDAHLYLYDRIGKRYGDLMAPYASELFQLLNANGPSYIWGPPTEWRSPYETQQSEWQHRLDVANEATAEQWRETVRLRKLAEEHAKEAEKQWREGCAMRAERDQLARQLSELQHRLDSR